jgi:hypothetical protein
MPVDAYRRAFCSPCLRRVPRASTPPASESGQFPLSSFLAPLMPSFIAPTPDATATPTPPGGPSAFAPCTIAPNFPAAFGGGKIPEVLSDP